MSKCKDKMRKYGFQKTRASVRKEREPTPVELQFPNKMAQDDEHKILEVDQTKSMVPVSKTVNEAIHPAPETRIKSQRPAKRPKSVLKEIKIRLNPKISSQVVAECVRSVVMKLAPAKSGRTRTTECNRATSNGK